MIGFLQGKVIEKNETSVIVLAGGVGYEVNLPPGELGKLKKDEETSLHIYTQVREDILALYGFLTREELNFFKLLLGVSGIGPKVALSIVGSAPLDRLKDSISKGDPTLLASVSGVGKKTAEKAVIELKGKLGNVTGTAIYAGEETEDIFNALLGLGFQRAEIAESLCKIPLEIQEPDKKIKELIKMMGKK